MRSLAEHPLECYFAEPSIPHKILKPLFLEQIRPLRLHSLFGRDSRHYIIILNFFNTKNLGDILAYLIFARGQNRYRHNETLRNLTTEFNRLHLIIAGSQKLCPLSICGTTTINFDIDDFITNVMIFCLTHNHLPAKHVRDFNVVCSFDGGDIIDEFDMSHYTVCHYNSPFD